MGDERLAIRTLLLSFSKSESIGPLNFLAPTGALVHSNAYDTSLMEALHGWGPLRWDTLLASNHKVT